MIASVLCVLLSSWTFAEAIAKDERRLASTPQMGWNSWNRFACDISEKLIIETADSLKSTGLLELGYEYVNLDDCWQAKERSEEGKVVEDSTRFPSGLNSLGKYLHENAFKFGIYSSAGFKTCQAYPASLGLEWIDAESYFDWNVDYLKYDNCFQDSSFPENRYKMMGDALAAVFHRSNGREVFYSLCEWGRHNPAVWASNIGANSWRISPDIKDGWHSIISRAAISIPLWRYAGPQTGWNDPDMLEIGNGHGTYMEYLTHFNLWAILKAPLIIGNDVRELVAAVKENPNADNVISSLIHSEYSQQTMNPDTNLTALQIFSLLSNKEVIAVNQDALGYQGRLVWSDVSQFVTEKYPYAKKLIATKCFKDYTELRRREGYTDALSSQEWTYIADKGLLKSVETGLCLTEDASIFTHILSHFQISSPEDKPPTKDVYDTLTFSPLMNGVTTTTCDEATTWDINQSTGGAIISRQSHLCLEVSKFDFAPIIQGKRVQTAPCQHTELVENNYSKSEDLNPEEHQSWTLPLINFKTTETSSRSFYLHNLYQRQCVTVDRDAYLGLNEEIYMSPLHAGQYAVLLFNKSNLLRRMTLSYSALGLLSGQSYLLRDLWRHETRKEVFDPMHSEITVMIPAHGSIMFKLIPLDLDSSV